MRYIKVCKRVLTDVTDIRKELNKKAAKCKLCNQPYVSMDFDWSKFVDVPYESIDIKDIYVDNVKTVAIVSISDTVDRMIYICQSGILVLSLANKVYTSKDRYVRDSLVFDIQDGKMYLSTVFPLWDNTVSTSKKVYLKVGSNLSVVESDIR